MKFFLWGFLGTLAFLVFVVLLVVIFSFRKKTTNTNLTQSTPTTQKYSGLFKWLNWENLLGWGTTFFIFGLIFLVGLGIYYLIFNLVDKKDRIFGPTSNNLEEVINSTSKKYGVDPQIVKAVIQVESGFQLKAISPKGAMGLMQLMPETAKSYGVKNAFDPKENIEGGVHLLSDLLKKYNGNLELALAAYNSGENTVDSLVGNSEEKNFSKISSSLPQETRNYVPTVIAVMKGKKPITPPMYKTGVMPAPPEILAKPGEWSPFYSARAGTRLRPTGKIRIQSRTGLTLDVDEDLTKPSRSLDDTVFRVISTEDKVTLLVLEK